MKEEIKKKLNQIDKKSREHWFRLMQQTFQQDGVKIEESNLSYVNEFVSQQKANWLWSEGKLLLAKGKLNEAIAYANEALSLAPDHMPSFLLLGTAYAYNEQFEEGVKILSKSLEIELRKEKDRGVPNALNRGYLLMTIAYIYKLQGDRNSSLHYSYNAFSLIEGDEAKKELEFKKNDRDALLKLKNEIMEGLSDIVLN